MNKLFGEVIAYDIGGGWGTELPKQNSGDPGYVIRGTDIPRVAVGDTSTVPLRFHKPSNLESRVLKAGDIVFEVSGGSKGQPVGRALQITDSVLAKFEQSVMCASFCKLIRLDGDAASPGYVFRVLQAAYADGRLGTYQVQSTGITNFKWKPFLQHFFVSLPDRDVQERVASIFDVLDDLIENNRRRIELLESMARAIYREWFVHFRFPGHENVPMVDSDLGPIPEGWQWGTVNDLVELVNSTVNPAQLDSRTPAVGLEHIPRHQLTLDDWGAACEINSRKAEFAKGDVLFGKIRPYFHKVSVAPVTGICSTDALVLRPVPEHWGQVVESIASDEFVGFATQTSNGTKMPRADWKVIREFIVAIPPSKVSLAFTTLARDCLGLAEGLMFQSRVLASTRDLLLPKLITGQIDVSDLDLDAVASEAVA